ncbi:hypothetical protein BST97_01150 [Nonlabens spongiae]|uniref:SMP-30/Gluconolactonase/LRE-like region domain-containing protein n=1 Tax=Nonlabens spongiae TaxID=331648 RepID=A0A1W6MGJ3_9FLAO|nr:hypothetical protein [Nonlabens spongiae]ARN76721.1 hypothetical protein BST97_01150 [Nonlabens spongiae]
MKKKIFALALFAAVMGFTSCSDDDEVVDGSFDRSELYATSNGSGNITIYDFSDSDEVEVTTLTTSSNDNEGIQYNPSTDELYFNSRSDFSLYRIGDVEDQIDGLSGAAINEVQGSIDFDSPRALAISGNTIVVSDEGDDTLFVYDRTDTGVSLRNEFDVDFELWGIEFVGNDLYAVVDQTNDIAIFNNFLSNSTNGNLEPTKRITIEGLVRTHGIAYSADDNVMILTDIGDAGSDSDGGLHIISDPLTKINAVTDGGTLAVANNQVRVAGAATLLGNPVDVTYDDETETIFVAEKANGGGRILGFNVAASGNEAPVINNALPGASSVDFYSED